MDKAIRNGLIVGGVLALVGLLLSFKNKGKGKLGSKKNLDPTVEDPQISKEYNFHLIPDQKGNYRSAQIPANVLPYVIKKYGIKRIIRLNGDGQDARHRKSHPETPRSVEQKICIDNGCQFEYIYGGQGYKRGQGYTTSLQKVSAILDQGNTLIHCAHGADRTGGLVGGYLKTRRHITDLDQLWAYTTKYNGWMSMIRKGTFYGSGFDKYADTFYPIDELKKKYP